jgi:hypothetical protein
MLIGIAALLAMSFIAFLIFQALNGRFPKLHVILYMLSALAGVFSFVYFLGMDGNAIIKVTVSIVLGVVLIFFASSIHWRRRA